MLNMLTNGRKTICQINILYVSVSLCNFWYNLLFAWEAPLK